MRVYTVRCAYRHTCALSEHDFFGVLFKIGAEERNQATDEWASCPFRRFVVVIC